MRFVGLIDCNNFFVSCERLFRPDLQNVPVLVLSSNDGCVVARSREIKDIGVPMGVPYFQIKDIIKDTGTVCFSSHFALYRDISSRVCTVVREHFPVMEQYSIDEAFFSFEADSIELAEEAAGRLKAAVEKRVGIPVTVGIATSKTQAKLVTAYAKKRSGVMVAVLDDFYQQFAATELREVWGVGGRLSRRYSEAGIRSIKDLIEADVHRIAALFGVGSTRLQAELKGTAVYAVSDTKAVPKSIMSTRSFATKTSNLALISDALAHHVRSVTEDARQQSLLVGTLTVILQTARHGDYTLRGGARSIVLPLPSSDTTYCLAYALDILRTLFESDVPYNKVGCVVSGLVPKAFIPQTLWGSSIATTSTLDTVLDSLNTRFGRDTVRVGQFVAVPSWHTKQTLLSPAYTTSWQDLKKVQTK